MELQGKWKRSRVKKKQEQGGRKVMKVRFVAEIVDDDGNVVKSPEDQPAGVCTCAQSWATVSRIDTFCWWLPRPSRPPDTAFAGSSTAFQFTPLLGIIEFHLELPPTSEFGIYEFQIQKWRGAAPRFVRIFGYKNDTAVFVFPHKVSRIHRWNLLVLGSTFLRMYWIVEVCEFEE